MTTTDVNSSTIGKIEQCTQCEGTGTIFSSMQMLLGGEFHSECEECLGMGMIATLPTECPSCSSITWLPKGRSTCDDCIQGMVDGIVAVFTQG